MRTLIPQECKEWIHLAGANVLGEFEILLEMKDNCDDAQLSRFLVEWLGEFENALLWITDWPFYKLDEMALIMGLRRSHGYQRNLIESPGHIFNFSESPELTGWISLLLRFGWDGQVIPYPFRGDSFKTSHHYTVQVWSPGKERLKAVKETAPSFGLELIMDKTTS